MSFITDFAEILDDLIAQRKMNAQDFAKDSGVQPSSVSEYLRALRIPTVARLVQLADYFGCSTDYLLGFEEKPNDGNYSACPPFNKQLEFLKKYYKCTNSYIYKGCGIPKTRFYDWLKGEHVPSLENVIKLAQFFNCSVDFVIGRTKA